MASLRVAIIIVTYNSSKFINPLIHDIAKLVFPREQLRVIFVDNCSSDNTVHIINKVSHDLGLSDLVHVIRLRKNIGLPAALAVGIYYATKHFKPHIFVIANPDIRILDSEILLKMEEAFKLSNNICMISPLIVHLRDPNKIQWTLGLLDFTGTAYMALYDISFKKLKAIPVRMLLSPWNTFAFVAIRSDALAKLGLPRIDFFLYYEDVEYSLRALERGCINVVLLEPAIAHYEGGSTKDINRFFTRFYFVRNSLIVTAEYLGIISFGLRLLSYIFLTLLNRDKAVLYGMIRALMEIMRHRSVIKLNSKPFVKCNLIRKNNALNYFLKCFNMEKSLRMFSLFGFIEYLNLIRRCKNVKLVEAIKLYRRELRL